MTTLPTPPAPLEWTQSTRQGLLVWRPKARSPWLTSISRRPGSPVFWVYGNGACIGQALDLDTAKATGERFYREQRL